MFSPITAVVLIDALKLLSVLSHNIHDLRHRISIQLFASLTDELEPRAIRFDGDLCVCEVQTCIEE